MKFTLHDPSLSVTSVTVSQQWCGRIFRARFIQALLRVDVFYGQCLQENKHSNINQGKGNDAIHWHSLSSGRILKLESISYLLQKYQNWPLTGHVPGTSLMCLPRAGAGP